MAWLDREFIAVPEGRKNQLVYKWPDVNIRRYSRAIVNADEIALFVKSGRVVATMGPGRHRVDATELPLLGALVDGLTGGKFYRAELFFVSTRETTGIKFGGRLADITDPASRQVVTLRVFGEFALSVRDPAELIASLVGTTDLTAPTVVENWSADLLLKAMKVAVAQGISNGDWPVLGLAADMGPIEAAVLRQTNITLYEYGLRIPRLGNFDITLDPADADRLKRLAKDTTYIHLAGDFQRYAAGELALGASEGFARGGTTGEGGFLGAALGINAIQQQNGGNIARPALAAPAPTLCGECHTANPAGARFCMDCGAPLGTPAPRPCRACGAELLAAAKFCGACGASVTHY
ncbi:SPFH domain-containing protein [Nocardia brasiliensis]|uniref:SPFH domain-containing protein n=1 Tax=Nocardia brasiliensis TaxID=37326 RepID=UPI002458C080|nr:SPFH domain-containing protein [Nocardia brasiliensis]